MASLPLSPAGATTILLRAPEPLRGEASFRDEESEPSTEAAWGGLRASPPAPPAALPPAEGRGTEPLWPRGGAGQCCPGRRRRWDLAEPGGGNVPLGKGLGPPCQALEHSFGFFFLSLKHPEMTKTKVGCAGPAPRHQGGAGSYASIAEPTTKDQNSNVKTHEILTYTKLGAFLFTSCFCYSVKPQVQSVSAYIDLFSFFSFLFFLFSEKQLKFFIYPHGSRTWSFIKDIK